MSTSNSEVFNRFLALIKDEELCSLLTDEQLTNHLEYFVNESLSVYFKECTKDLTNTEQSDFHSQTSTATIGQTDFVLTKYPTDPNEDAIELICTVDDVATPYTFNDVTYTFVLDTPLSGGETVVYGYNFVGQFNEDLDDEEKWILAHGMVVTWNSGQLYSEKKLKNAMSTSDYKQFSPANLIDKLLALRTQSLREIRQLRVSYSFNGFTGFN